MKWLFHAGVIATAIIVIMIVSVRQSTINFEDMPTYPQDYMPKLTGTIEYPVEIVIDGKSSSDKDKDKDSTDIRVDYRLGRFDIPAVAVTALPAETVNRPLPTSPVAPVFVLPKAVMLDERLAGREELTLALAITSSTAGVWEVKANGITLSYVSNVFAGSGYMGNTNSIVIYTKIDIIKDIENRPVKIEINRVKTL